MVEARRMRAMEREFRRPDTKDVVFFAAGRRGLLPETHLLAEEDQVDL